MLSTLPDSDAERRLRIVFASALVDESSQRYDANVIEVTADQNSEDLGQFVYDTLTRRINRKYPLEGNVEKTLKEKIARRRLERSKGMFSHASFLIDRLCDESINESTVLKEINELPGMTATNEAKIIDKHHLGFPNSEQARRRKRVKTFEGI